MKRIRIAHPNVDMFELLAETLRGIFQAEAIDVSHVRSAQEALELLKSDPADLFVAYVHLAPDRHTSPAQFAGVELVRNLRSAGLRVPSILIAPSTTRDLSVDVQTLADATLVLEGHSFEADFTAHVQAAFRRLAATQAPVAPKRRATKLRAVDTPARFVIDIRLRLDGNCTYSAWSRGGSVPYQSNKRFSIDPKDLADLIERSRQIGNADQWTQDYRAIGEKLRDSVMNSNLEVRDDINIIRGLMFRELPNAIPSIRFIIETGIHSIALEAILDQQNDYWMQRAPVWRQLDLRVLQYPLFQDVETRDGAINCLIVEADAEGRASELDREFDPLPGVKQEADSLEDYLRDRKRTSIGKIGRIRRDAATGEVRISVLGPTRTVKEWPRAQSYRTALRELLTGAETWHIVHYAGHTYYDARNDCGYIVLPGNPLEVVGTPEVATWLSRTRFVYMSSCRGSSQDFVFHFCKCNVPAVAGFRWDVDDARAREHSQLFYQELIDRRSLEDAFVETWKHMYGKYRMDRVWTSTELVVQLAA
jgi:hypothetical protein